MLKDVTFGQYYPTKSFVHSLDSAIKIILLIAYIVMIFTVKNFYGFLLTGGLLLTTVIFARVPILSVLKSIKGILVIVVITAIINVFSYAPENSTIVFKWWILSVTKEGLIFSAFMILRLTLLVAGSCLLTLTTTPVALTDGLEVLLYPLKLIKFPVHELALIMSIALRCIPSLMEETDRIMSAQKARGADFESGNLFKRIKALVPILIPLLVSSFRRAEELGDAMDSRCYRGSTGRTKFKQTKITFRDVIALIIISASVTGVVLLNGAYPHVI